MVLFLTAILVGSCLGLFLLLWAKHWELSTGRVILGTARVRLARISREALITLEYRVPLLARVLWLRLLSWLRGGARAALAQMLLKLEHALERVLNFLRHGLSSAEGGSSQVSVFLQEVAEHKKRLMRRTSYRNRAPII